LGVAEALRLICGVLCLPSGEEEKPATIAHTNQMSQRGHMTIIILQAIRHIQYIRKAEKQPMYRW